MRVSSSSWYRVNLRAINNFDDSISVKERDFNHDENCYLSKINFEITEESAFKLYKEFKHYFGECDSSCEYCEDEDDF